MSTLATRPTLLRPAAHLSAQLSAHLAAHLAAHLTTLLLSAPALAQQTKGADEAPTTTTGGESSETIRQRFAVELMFGQTTGLTPYQRDVVFMQTTGEVDATGTALARPYLADELNSWGNQLGMRFLIGDMEVGLSIHTMTRDQLKLNWRGDRTIQVTRQRPDGSVDDSGVSYTARPAGTEDGSDIWLPQTTRVSQRGRGSLMVGVFGGGKRFELWRQKRWRLFAPAGGGVALTHITEDAMPYKLGLQVEGGLGAEFDLAENIAISASGRLMALGTMSYGRRDDASRRAEIVGEGTVNTLFASMLYTNLGVSLIYSIR